MLDSKNKASNFFLETLPLLISDRISVLQIGRVTRYKSSEHTCNVKLLAEKNGNESASITEVIVPANIWKNEQFHSEVASALHTSYNKLFKVGSIVAIGFFDTEIDNYHGSSKYKVESHRRHSINDAIVLGVIKP